MKLHFTLLILVFFGPIACRSNSNNKAGSSVVVTVQNDNNCNGATITKACRMLVESGVDPSKIKITDDRGLPSIQFSSNNNIDHGPLQNMFSEDKYDGQVVLLRRNDQKTIFSGSSKLHYWFIVDETVTINSLIDTISSKRGIEYIICDVDYFRENIRKANVTIEHNW